MQKKGDTGPMHCYKNEKTQPGQRGWTEGHPSSMEASELMAVLIHHEGKLKAYLQESPCFPQKPVLKLP